MRNFKFIGDSESYNWIVQPTKDQVYPENHQGKLITKEGIIETRQLKYVYDCDSMQGDWEEVYNTEKQPIENDSDNNFVDWCAVQIISGICSSDLMRLFGDNEDQMSKSAYDIAYAMNRERLKRLKS